MQACPLFLKGCAWHLPSCQYPREKARRGYSSVTRPARKPPLNVSATTIAVLNRIISIAFIHFMLIIFVVLWLKKRIWLECNIDGACGRSCADARSKMSICRSESQNPFAGFSVFPPPPLLIKNALSSLPFGPIWVMGSSEDCLASIFLNWYHSNKFSKLSPLFHKILSNHRLCLFFLIQNCLLDWINQRLAWCGSF